MEIENLDVSGAAATYTLNNATVRLQPVAQNIVRCTVAGPGGFHDESPLGIALPGGEAPKWRRTDESGGALAAGTLRVAIDRTGLHWMDADGSPLCSEAGWELAETPVIRYTTGDEPPVVHRVQTVDGERSFIQNLRPTTERTALRATHHFAFAPGERIHGLGQGEEGIFNYRGHTQYLYQHNMRIPVPFFLSSAGYGVLYDCGCLMTFNDDERGSYLFFDTVDQLDYYLIHGPAADTIIAGFRALTGAAALLPKWAYGYIQSKEAYRTQDELVEIAAEYRRRGLPLDCVVQDWNTWGPGQWGNKQVDRARYPDLPAMNRTLHEMQVHSMVSVWPNMNPGCPNHTEFEQAGLLLQDLSTYDAFSEEGRRIYWRQAEEELFSGGFDAWWCDSTEPFSGPDWNGPIPREPWERFALVGGEHKKYLDPAAANLYALAHARGIWEHQRAAAPGKRVLNLTRSGTAGSQRYGTVLWSGDICARWDVLRTQLTEGLNAAASGMPWWTLDIGGFFTVRENWQHRGCGQSGDSRPLWFWRGDFENGVDDPGYRELYLRWFQLGAFLPMFRAHGTDTPRELWQFGAPGDEIYDALVKTLRLRYRLMPYIYTQAALVSLRHGTLMRPLFFDFAADEQAARCSDEYMFGPSLLVCPVTQPMYRGPGGAVLNAEPARACILPAGCDWYDYWTDARLPGGQTVTAAAPLDTLPLFVRAGSVIPMEQGLQFAAQPVDTPLELHVWPGENGRAELYEDANDGYGYERSEYNLIGLAWDEAAGRLQVGESPRRFAGGLAGRTLEVVLHDGTGRRVRRPYTGSTLDIQL